MEIALLVAGLIILVLCAAMIRAWTVSERLARDEADRATTALETTRRIDDATRDPHSVDGARGWLRDFGSDAPTGER